jgi:hypothetical protein
MFTSGGFRSWALPCSIQGLQVHPQSGGSLSGCESRQQQVAQREDPACDLAVVLLAAVGGCTAEVPTTPYQDMLIEASSRLPTQPLAWWGHPGATPGTASDSVAPQRPSAYMPAPGLGVWGVRCEHTPNNSTNISPSP